MSENIPKPPSPLTPEEIRAWLDYQAEQLIKRCNEVVEGLREMARAHPTIEDGDDETAGRFIDNLGMAKALVKSAEALHTREKAPYLQGGKTVDAWKANFLGILARAMDPVSKIVFDYSARKDEIELKQREEEARRLAEAAAQAVKYDAFSEEADVALTSAARAKRDTMAKPAERSQTRGVYGTLASIRQTWTWEITDIESVPRNYLTIDSAKLREAMKTRDKFGKPVTMIPGISWVTERSLGVR
jgi:hypothetical protein